MFYVFRVATWKRDHGPFTETIHGGSGGMGNQDGVRDLHVLRNIVDHVLGQDGVSFPLRVARHALQDGSPRDGSPQNGFDTPPLKQPICFEAVSSSCSEDTITTRIDELLADFSDSEVYAAPRVSLADSFDLMIEELELGGGDLAVVTVMHGRIPHSVICLSKQTASLNICVWKFRSKSSRPMLKNRPRSKWLGAMLKESLDVVYVSFQTKKTLVCFKILFHGQYTQPIHV